MRKKVISISIIFVLIFCFSACADNKGTSSIDYSNDTFDYQNDNMEVGYLEEFIKQPTAALLYETLNPIGLKETPDINNSKGDCILLWFRVYTAQSSISGGYYGIYENDLVVWTSAPYTCYCEYYEAPQGTYKALQKILSEK